MLLWKLKKLKKLARYSRLGSYMTIAFAAKSGAECIPHPKVSSFNFFNFINFFNSQKLHLFPFPFAKIRKRLEIRD